MQPLSPRALRSGDCYGYSQLGAWRGCPQRAPYLRATPSPARASPPSPPDRPTSPFRRRHPSSRIAQRHTVRCQHKPPARARARCRRKPIASRARNAQGRRSHSFRLSLPQRAGFTDCHPYSRTRTPSPAPAPAPAPAIASDTYRRTLPQCGSFTAHPAPIRAASNRPGKGTRPSLAYTRPSVTSMGPLGR